MDWLMGTFPWLVEDLTWWQVLFFALDYTIKFIAIGWVPENRSPSASTAWLLLILLIPFIGLPLFLFLGSQQITGRRHEVQALAQELIAERTEHLPDVPDDAEIEDDVVNVFKLSRQLTGMPAIASAEKGLFTEFDASIDRMIETIDAAQKSIHVQSYIFALDSSTEPFIQALERAHDRGLEVKVLVDPIGSWKYPGYYKLKKRLDQAKISWHPMLPVSLLKLTWRRLDLRNHRKLVVVDGDIVFMGSQNLIEPEYQKKKNHKIGRRWVDTWIELEGDIALAFDAIFAIDWTSELYKTPDATRDYSLHNTEVNDNYNVVQVLPSGPGFSTEPNLRVFNNMIYQAHERIIAVSPYFVPDESMLMALTSAAYGGIDVQLYVNEESDQFMVGHAQQSYYQVLLTAGVKIYRYPAPAVLHSKFMVIDDRMAMFGSSNLDMRSFGLNYEITLLSAAGSIVDKLIMLADEYRDKSFLLTQEEWNDRPLRQRYLDSVFRLTSALQ
ncbi:cardiolipin synthase [Corynebacterium sp. HMSC072D01]|uniref:cardiolipin synthase n=1 Tax=Corynebacterium sp. HMSC072D01 TaxID=1739403 RepID=UPI0008AA1FBF